MAKNDVVLMDAIIDDRLRESYPSNQRDEVFEFLAFEQILKDLDLSREEIETSWMDGRDDGGVSQDVKCEYPHGYLHYDTDIITHV